MRTEIQLNLIYVDSEESTEFADKIAMHLLNWCEPDTISVKVECFRDDEN